MIEIIDPTRLRASLQCQRLYYWEQERNIVPIKPKLALAYGIAVHECLASHYTGGKLSDSLAKFEEIWDREVTPYLGEMDEEDPKRNPRRWAEQFVQYRQYYRNEPWTVLTLPSGKPAVEVPFYLPLTENLALAGIIDLIVEYLGQIMIVDHKTTSYMNAKWIKSFNPNHQFSAYLLAANVLLKPKKPITTLIVNAILTHATEKRPEKLFDRPFTTRNINQLNEFQKMITAWWTSSVRMSRETGAWPQNDDRCERWPEGCAYKDLCTDVGCPDHLRLIPSPSVYREHIHDPLATIKRHGLMPDLPEGGN